MKIEVTGFRGMRPGVGDAFLESDQAVLAQDCRLYSGELRPLRAGVQRATLTKSGSIQTIYFYQGQYWFHWAGDVDVVPSVVPGDPFDMVFWTGDGQPKATTAQLATSGSNMPTVSRHLGVPSPTVAPTVSVTAGEWPEEGEPEYETRFYVYTFVNSWGWESAPSAPSLSVTAKQGDTVELTGLENPPTGPYDWAYKRIYRLSTGIDSSAFLYVGQIEQGATSFSDNVAGNALGEVMETEGWDPPPDTMKGLTALANGALAGFDGHNVYFSPIAAPYAYPRSYSLATEYDIVGLAAYENNLVVMTKGHPYLATGSDPAAMMLTKLEINQACVSKASITSVGALGVLYASPDGLVSVGSQVQIVSQEYMTREEWQAYNPSSIVGVSHDGAYIGFFTREDNTRGAFVFSPENGFTELSITATAAYSDLETDKLFYTDGSSQQVMEFDAGAPMSYRWRSKVFKLHPVSFSAYRVLGDGPFSDLTLRVFADGTELIENEVTSQDGRRLPTNGRARRWQIELEGKDPVEGVFLATSMAELAQ